MHKGQKSVIVISISRRTADRQERYVESQNEERRKGTGIAMSREEVFERLNEVFRDVFDDEEITVTDGTTADDIEEWDSLEHINLLAAVEQEFGMKFHMGQIVAMKNVGEMADIILSQIS